MRPQPAPTAPRRLLLAALLLAMLSLAACGLVPSVGGRGWSMTAASQAGTDSTTNVTDASGKVLSVESDPAGADLFSPVSVPANRPNTLDVAWTAGACDKTTDIAIASRAVGLAVTVQITSNGQPCDAMGLPRAIRLSLSGPIAPGAVTVSR